MNKLCTCRACGKLFSRKKPKPYCSPLCRLTHNNTHNTQQTNQTQQSQITAQTTSILEGATSNDRNTSHNTDHS